MEIALLFYFIMNEYYITRTLSLAVETALITDSKELAYRKSLADGAQNFVSLLKNIAIKKYSEADYREKDLLHSYAASMIINFFDRLYTCGSESARQAAPYIISMLEAVFEIPYIDFIISETVKKNIINSINTCATKSLAGNLKKRKKEPKASANTKNIPLTKAAKKSKRGKYGKSNSEIMRKLRTILDNVINDKIKNSNKKERNKHVKVFLEIGDNLKSELRKNRLLNDKILRNKIESELLVSDTEDRNKNTGLESSVSNIDVNESKENKELRVGFEQSSENRENHTKIDQNSSDVIVFNNNMEIFVRMDTTKENKY